MADPNGKAPEPVPTELEPTAADGATQAPHPAIERLLLHEEGARKTSAVSGELRPEPRPKAAGLTVGLLLGVNARKAVVSVDGVEEEASLGAHVDPEFLKLAMAGGEPVLMQQKAGGPLLVLGVVQGRHPSKLSGERVEVVAETEVVVRSGKSALRLREDGVVDLIGARISASSRGLLRLVGRALRLN